MILPLIISFILTFLIIKITIKLSFKVQNPTRSFVPKTDGEKWKVSPFGGVCIFLSSMITLLLFTPLKNLLILIPSILMLLLGLADDLKKVFSGSYDGISAKQKIIFQSLLACFVCFLAIYYNPTFNEFKILIPFFGVLNFKLPIALSFIIAFFAFNGAVNAVNLTDGLDGLAGKQVLVILAFLLTVLYGVKFNLLIDLDALKTIVIVFLGAILAFLVFNSNPASIFMGDAGSMGLGSIIASFFIILKLELILPFVGFIIFMEALSVIIQVAYFKKTGGKRIFKMSPLHHHYQLCGMKEQKITELAFLITIMLSLIFITSFF
jgi:phospho-N-acetylmuramoyl-pentapeptide-transferase